MSSHSSLIRLISSKNARRGKIRHEDFLFIELIIIKEYPSTFNLTRPLLFVILSKSHRPKSQAKLLVPLPSPALNSIELVSYRIMMPPAPHETLSP